MEDARLAVVDDVERIAQLCLLGRDELSTRRGGDLLLRRESPLARGRADLTARLATPDQTAWVGTLDAHVVGYGLARLDRLGAGLVLGVLEELYVEPEARSVGVGQAVMESLLGWFGSNGCVGVDAQALPGDRRVKTFLESSGFKARLIVLHRSLSS